MQLLWSARFIGDFKRLARRNPQLRSVVEQILQQLAEDPFYPSLRTHKLKGDLLGTWACSIDYNNRILFESSSRFWGISNLFVDLRFS